MSGKFNCITMAISAGLLLFGNQASANTITTTNFSNWKIDLTNAPTEVNFNSVQLSNYSTAAGITLTPSGDPADAFNITGPDKGGYNLSGYLYKHQYTVLAGAADGIGVVKVTTPVAGEDALWLGVGNTSGSTVTVQLSDGEAFVAGTGGFGLVLSQPITSFTISTASGAGAFLNDIWFGSSTLDQGSSIPAQSATPESSTISLLGGGLLILAGCRRRMLKRVSI